jgi:hypothetical protein
MSGNVLPARVTRTDDEPPSDLNTIGAMAIPGEKTHRSHSFLSFELQVKRSTAQSAYERWHQAGVFKHAMGRKDNRSEAWGG